ncbi:MAG: molecular chaperone Hsp33 [Alphaproteobacteria bacterium]|nr:molecular chaperone Hsp33 [Alphaproteobacteria bacterium]HCP01821.1 molecular chaperone Hsp33 [Rhodospirillaceae bacterium]
MGTRPLTDYGGLPERDGAGQPVDDLIQPFQLESGESGEAKLSGRLTQLGEAVDDVMRRHKYPEPVAELLGEALALSVILAGALKFDGIFTLQVQGDGPVSLLLADVQTKNDTERYLIRGYANYTEDALASHDPAESLLGSGYFALTVDQGPHTDRYQGMVEITGKTLAECAQHYFRQSQQMDAAISLSAGRLGPDGPWRAGGVMVQRIADDPNRQLPSDDDDDTWRRVMMLMATGTMAELLDPALGAKRYLFRLFHEEGVRATDPRSVAHRCRCSSDRVFNVLVQLPREDLRDLAVDGNLEVTCEFCSESYHFTPEAVEARAAVGDPVISSPESADR